MFAKSLITQLTHFDVSNTIVIIELSHKIIIIIIIINLCEDS